MDIDKYFRKNITIPIWLYRQGMRYAKELALVNMVHTYSIDALREYQLKRIKSLFTYAYQNVPYYRNEWKLLGVEPEDILTLEDFYQLPTLTKSKLREHADEILSMESRKKKLIKSGTGGTTDSPIILYYDYPRARMKDAEMHYFRQWFRWEMADKVAYLWGAPQDIPNIKSLKSKVINRLTHNKLFLFSSLLNAEIMNEFVERINQFKPDIIQGYSNPTFILANHILQRGIKIHSAKSIVLTAEPCLPHQRKIIESAFNSEVFTFYGCREGGYVGCECNHHNGYHINCSSIYMEFLTENGHAKPGELSNIVFTDLYNFDMPFIRYQIGDLGIPTDTNCECGSTLPLMEFFAGRETDVFVTPNGDFVPGVSLCDRIIEDCVGMEQLQFVQNRTDELVVKIVKGKSYSNDDMRLLDIRLSKYFQNKLNIKKEFVDNIPKEKSGKTRFCISNVHKKL